MRARVLLVIAAAHLSLGFAPSPYRASIESWRQERETRLKAPDGWLAVAGLFWLKEGDNRVGGDPSFEIALPSGRAPASIGVFEHQNQKTVFRPGAGISVQLNGGALSSAAELKPDSSGKPDVLTLGDFTMFVIQRGSRFAIRMRDTRSKMREEFTGLHWYPVRESYRISARWVAYDEPRKIAIPNILGETENQPSPGYAEFQLMGHTYRLDPVLEGSQLFFIFRDQTSGRTTYGAGRFLYAELPKEGKVLLDFNKAYNPPCAFTPYATCPLPPKQNRLPAKIEAGELKYGDH